MQVSLVPAFYLRVFSPDTGVMTDHKLNSGSDVVKGRFCSAMGKKQDNIQDEGGDSKSLPAQMKSLQGNSVQF